METSRGCANAEASRAVLQETGLLPHVNAGVLSRDEFAALKTVSGELLPEECPIHRFAASRGR